MSYQKLIIVGNLGHDPQMRYTPDGQAVTHFSMATNRRWTQGDGATSEETTWFRVTAWGRLAEVAAQYLHQGRQVMVEGRLNPARATGGPRIWTGNDGEPHANYEVTVERLVLLNGKTSGRDTAANAAATNAAAPAISYEDTDEIPF